MLSPTALVSILVYSWCHTFFDAVYWTITTGHFDVASTGGPSRFSEWASAGESLNLHETERVSCTISNMLDHASRDNGTWARFALDTTVFVVVAGVLLASAPADVDSTDRAQLVL